MDSVFISSVQTGFEAERQAARQAVESLGLKPVMAETVGASPLSSRDALLGHVDESDAFVLILGARYGEPGDAGFSPTEDEFNRAVETRKDVLVFVQEGVDREPAQDAFVRRVRGRWEQGRYAPGFSTPADLGFAVVRALRELADQYACGDAAPAAQQRAGELARGQHRSGYVSSGAPVRVVLVPVGAPSLLDAVALEDPELAGRVATIVRGKRIVSHRAGLQDTVSAAGVQLLGREEGRHSETVVVVGAGGSVWVQADCVVEGQMTFGAISEQRVEQLVVGVSGAAQEIWGLIDRGGRVRQVACAIGVPEADMKVLATDPIGNSMSMSMRNPGSIVVPDPALVVRRNDVGAEVTTRQLLAALRRAFADLGAVHSG